MTKPDAPHDTLGLILDEIRLSGASLNDVELAPGTDHVFDTLDRVTIYIGQHLTIRIEPANHAAQDIGPGDLMVVTTGGRHRLSTGTERARQTGIADPARVTCGAFRYDTEFAAPLIASLPPIMKFCGSGPDAPPWLVTGLAFLEQERSVRQPAAQAVINRVLDILMIECLRAEIERIPADVGNWLAALRDRQLSEVLAAIHADPLHAWTVGELADIARLSRSAFATRFTQTLATPPMAYLSALRLRMAMRQLQHSSAPVKSIAAALGYESPVGFTQAFKKHFGIPPSAVRTDAAAALRKAQIM